MSPRWVRMSDDFESTGFHSIVPRHAADAGEFGPPLIRRQRSGVVGRSHERTSWWSDRSDLC
jgi:hypothetical protein